MQVGRLCDELAKVVLDNPTLSVTACMNKFLSGLTECDSAEVIAHYKLFFEVADSIREAGREIRFIFP